jgi:hypothetical protein
MPIATIDKIEALIAGVTREQIQQLSPIRRQRLTQALRYIADMADPSQKADPRSGALGQLRDGERAEDCDLPAHK